MVGCDDFAYLYLIREEASQRDRRSLSYGSRNHHAERIFDFPRKKKVFDVTDETEREGFEPSVRVTVHSISSAAPSAARSPLQWILILFASRLTSIAHSPFRAGLSLARMVVRN